MLSKFICDVYDDPKGSVLRSIFPTPESVPSIVKTASYLSDADREALPDDRFAVIAVEGDRKMRKFAMHDAGNVALSAIYLLHQAKNLPGDFAKTAAENLVEAHAVYGLEVPGALLFLARAGAEKTASLLGEEGISRAASRMGPVAEGRYVQASAPVPTTPDYVPERTLLEGRYPVDSYEQTKVAAEYFIERHKEMQPLERHEYCVKLASRLLELDIPVPAEVADYAHETRNPGFEGHMEMRRHLAPEEYRPVVDDILAFEKEGSYPLLTIAGLVDEFDRASGLDKVWEEKVANPAKTVFGRLKEFLDKPLFNGLGYIIREHHLERLARHDMKSVCKAFGEEFAEKFRADPVKAFKSLDKGKQTILSHIALDTVERV